ncbi:MAG: rod shape-determining protein MreC [Bacteroidota bacterium]|nr:rod shape-determining protein MreC [Bacteroidota bacterium]
MQQIINLLLKRKNFLIYLSLLFFSLFFLTQRSFFHKSLLNKISLTLSSSLYSFKEKTLDYFSLKEKNQILMIENEKLKKYKLLYQSQLLDSANNLNFPFKTIGAKIVKNSHIHTRNYLILDKGLKDSVSIDMGVISNDGVIGIINQITNNFSSVISVLNKDLKINVKFKKNLAFGSLLWDGETPDKMKLIDIAIINPVSKGDTIITGGMSTYFPEGIPIGIVSNYKTLPSENYYDIDIKLFSNLTQKRHVYIIGNENSKEIKLLENNE